MPRNHLAQDLLIEADRRNPWTRKALTEICDRAYADKLIVLVSTPSKQIVFVLSPDADADDFCDQLEMAMGQHIRDRRTWPDLELDAEPVAGWHTPEHLKGWLDKPPLSEWTEEERQFAWDAFQNLAMLDHDKAIYCAKDFVKAFEEAKREWQKSPWNR